MSSLNKVTLIGNAGRDPEIRYNQGGDPIANLSIATSERWTDKNSGEKKEKTEWHRVVVFDPALAGVVEKYVKKGSKLYVEGQMQTRKWTDQHGTDRYVTEVVLQRFRGQIILLGDRGPGGPPPNTGEGMRATGTDGAAGASPSPNPNDPLDLDDDIPF